jgi:hypothetical protein
MMRGVPVPSMVPGGPLAAAPLLVGRVTALPPFGLCAVAAPLERPVISGMTPGGAGLCVALPGEDDEAAPPDEAAPLDCAEARPVTDDRSNAPSNSVRVNMRLALLINSTCGARRGFLRMCRVKAASG